MPERIRIAFVGLNFGHYLAEQIIHGPGSPYFELAAVCDQNPQRAEEGGKRYHVPAYTHLDELLARADIPAIGLFTPPIRRALLLKTIMQAGKDIITTKPFEIDPLAAREVLEEARKYRRVIHLNSPSPLMPPDLAQIQAWAKEFRLGRPVGCRGEAWHGGGLNEKADGSWYDDPELCPLAPMYRIGIYLINDLLCLWGKVSEVQALQARVCTGRPTPDTALAGLRFQNGALGSLFTSLCVGDNRPDEHHLTLNYEHGTIYRNVGFSSPNRADSQVARLALNASGPNGKDITRQVEIEGISGSYQWAAFYQAIHGEPVPLAPDPDVLVAGLQIIQALKASAKSGMIEVVKT